TPHRVAEETVTVVQHDGPRRFQMPAGVRVRAVSSRSRLTRHTSGVNLRGSIFCTVMRCPTSVAVGYGSRSGADADDGTCSKKTSATTNRGTGEASGRPVPGHPP